jgi:hypothetical protein
MFSSAPPAAVRRRSADPAALRLVIYAALLFGVARYFAGQYSLYLDAEQGRLESALLSQAIEHRKAVQEAMGETD